ncbi:hypothetical protein C6501_12410 [Candidatus Poribacteria bacterium]|nr:MAG: hypothetical protein C6501_12410 [Candidatus Poribacteria bacterium]
MKKRTLVCFLIFTLCVFHSSIPDTVFGQDNPSLAQQVFDKHKQVLQRANVKQYLPEIIEGLKGDLPFGLTPAGVINLAVNSVKTDPTGTNLKALAAQAGLTLTDDHIAIIADADVQAVLADDTTVALLSLTGDALAAGLDELLRLINAPVDPVDPTPPDPAPPTISITTLSPTTDQSGSFNVAFTTADVNGDTVTVTGSISSVEPAEAASYYSIPSGTLTSPVRITQTAPTTAMPTIPGATVTLTLVAKDGTVAEDGTERSASATIAVTFATVEKPPVDPVPPVKPTVDARLGGLSLNRVSGRAFIQEIVRASGLPVSSPDTLVEPIVDFVLYLIPKQVPFPKKQVKQILTQQSFSVFPKEPYYLDDNNIKRPLLDYENFGNAITPSLVISDLADVFDGTYEVKKYLTSDNLNVYVRVKDVLEGGNVKFNLNGRTVEGKRINPVEYQQETIPYTFRLDESLAATNLPAWPGSDTEIFSSVVLRYGEDGKFFDSHAMTRNADGVWEFELGIKPKGNVYYYFDVTLTHPVWLEVINPEALLQIAAAGTSTAPAVKVYEIEKWSMPDPRNLQLVERGIIKGLFDKDVKGAIAALLASPEVAPLIAAAAAGQRIDSAAIVKAIPQRKINQLQNWFFRNANRLISPFEGKPGEDGVYRGGTFDPKLASVFSVPEIDIETDSFWVANIDSIVDGVSNLQADVYNANDELLSQITVDFEVDTTAPAADIVFGDGVNNFGENVTGYENKEGIWVATTSNADAPAFLHIKSSSSDVDLYEGYLIYQRIKLDANGKPDPADTWQLLTILPSMLASNVWDIVKVQLEGNPNPTLQAAATLELNDVLPLLNAKFIQQFANPFFKPLGITLTAEQSALLVDLIGATVQDLNLIPLTYDPSSVMMHPIQSEKLPLKHSEGDWGIRAMGIDPLFNVGSHVVPTRLRIVTPEKEYDRARVSLAMSTIRKGDLNDDGDTDEWYESNHIFSNTPNVQLTVMIDERSKGKHPVDSIMVQYMGADGWQKIGELKLDEGADAPADGLTTVWNIPADVFQALVAAGDTVKVRAVATNRLQLTDQNPAEFTITLDGDVYPIDPKVLVVDVITDTDDPNPDSGAPRGNITLTGYAARRTFPATESISVQVSMDSETWIDVGTVEVMTEPEHGIDGDKIAAVMFKGNTLADVYKDNMLHIDDTSSYLQWSLDIDTVASGLADSITKEDLDAAHAASNKAGMTYVDLDGNRYMVRAYPVTSEGKDEDGVAEGDMFTEKFSLDNVDDVGPLGPTNIVATSINAVDMVFEDHGDGTYKVGGLVDKYDPEVNSPVVTFTITPTAKRNTYASVQLLHDLPEGAIIGAITETEVGVFTVTVDVGTLMDDYDFVHNNTYMEDARIENADKNIYNPKGKVFEFKLHALAYDADMEGKMQNVQTHDRDAEGQIIDTVDNKITVNVQNTYRPDPGVIAISVVNSDGMVNPDSGAPQGILTFDVYTYGKTSAPTEGIRVEVKRPVDDTWERITGTAMPSEIVSVSEVPVTDLSDILTDAANAGIINTGVIGVLVGISEAEGESPASLMKWSYEVDTRKLALEDTDAPENTIKLDDTINRGDGDSERAVSEDENRYVVRAYALTPKNQAQVEYPKRDEYLERGGVEAFFSLDNDDDVPPLGPTLITDVSDVAGSLAASEDGIYPEVITVGGIVDPGVESPVAIFSIQPTAEMITYEGGQIRLVQTAPDGTVTELPPVDVDEGQITVDVGVLPDGIYMYHALVGDNVDPTNWQVQGEDDKPSPVVTVQVLNISVRDNDIRDSNITDLTVTAVDGESPDRLPLQEGRYPLKESIAVSFNVDNGSLAVEDLTGVLVDGHEVTFTAGSDAENAFSLMADKLSEVADGWYTPEGRVTKRNGSVTFPLAMINLDNTGPMITIETPTEGHTVNDLPTLLAGFGDGDLGSGVSDGSGVSAADTAVVSLARLRPEEVVQDAVPIDVEQDMVEQDLDSVVYTRTDKLAGGAYQFTVKVKDKLDNEGTATVMFAVEGEDPIVVITAPASGQTLDYSTEKITGFFTGGGDVKITKFTINDEPVEPVESGNEFSYTLPKKDADADGALEDGKYTVAVEVTDGSGLTAQTSLTFTVELPVPTVAITTPHAGQVYDNGKPIIAGDFSGAAPIEVSLSIDNGEAMKLAGSDNNQFTYTPAVALSDGPHKVTVVVKDANGRTAETTTDFTIDIPGPTVMIHVPDAGQMYDISRPTIQGKYSVDAGATLKTLSLMLNDEPVDADDVVKSGNDFSYTLPEKDADADGALEDGEYTLVAVVTDDNGKTAEATAIFSVRLPVPTVLIDSPIAGITYNHTYRHISGEFTGVDPVSVVLMVDDKAVEAMVEGTEFTYDLSDKLSEGDHMVSVEITDANGETAQATTTFSVVYPAASVMIHSPIAADTYDHTYRHISGEFTGVGEVAVNLTVDDKAVEAMVEGTEFTYDLSDKLSEGDHMVSVEITDANGETAQATTMFSVVYPAPTVSIHSPAAGAVYEHGEPVIEGEFTGVGAVDVKITVDSQDVEVSKDGNQFTGELDDALKHGSYVIEVEVTDENGKSAKTSTNFIIDIPGPAVAIHSPASGQTYDHGKPVVRVEFSGMTDVEVTTFTVNGEDVAVEAEDNQFAYTPADALGTGEHVAFVEVTDANEKTAQATVVFNVKLDSTPPVISEVSPAGVVKLNKADILAENMAITISAVVLEEQSSISNMQYVINNGIPRSYPVQRATNKFEITESFAPGTHTIKLIAASEGGTREFEWQFTLEVDEAAPVISSITPAGTIHAGLPIISASATDESGVENIAIVVMDSNGEEVKGETKNDDEDRTNTGITRLDFHPEAPLSEGTYAIEVRATDAFGNSSTAKGGFTIDFDTAAPIITSSSPHNGARLMYKHDEIARPLLSITFGDAETGVNPDSIRLVIESPKAGGGSQAQPINLTDEQMSATQVLYTPAAPAFPNGFAEPGQYTVTLEVSDNAHQEGNVSEESDGARKANMAVYQFSFFVEFADAPILMKPFNFPNPFKDNTRISFGLNRMSTVSIVIYDVTGRPVRTLRDNVIMNAGNYTGQNGIGWDGKTSGGEDLARGIYYCVIEVTDGFEPESATLKLALTR